MAFCVTCLNRPLLETKHNICASKAKISLELYKMKLPKSLNELKQLGFSMTKFGLTSLLGTGLDFLTFTFLFRLILPLFWAEIAAAFIGMIVNFFMQKRFVFQLNRKAETAFFLSIIVSFVLMFAGAFILTWLVTFEPFLSLPLAAKVTVMGVKFIFNYVSKRWIFEKPLKRKIN